MPKPLCVLSLATALLAALPARSAEVDCLMEPNEVVELSSAVSGLLTEVKVRRGDRVEAGQLIARLDSKVEASTVELLDLRANSTSVIDAQRKQLDMVEKRYNRIATLRNRGVASVSDLDQVEGERIASQSLLAQAELNRDLAIKELARAKAALGQREIFSPISGVVALRNLTEGEYVNQDNYVVRIVQLDPLKIEAFVPISLFGKVKAGDTAIVHPAAPIEGAYKARVITVDRVFDAASGTFVVLLEIPNPDDRLPAGHRCRLEIGG
ncbi:MAG: efflux RND transporter periplasmic adaptor subunit [Alphaproteobacteria bacterium]|nr:efflux RND transporter periplasmic adaptor subunit [Alphaproteobacteria bacterium]MCB9928994.1 efflux RND transporter periplasmic adaptor subunit [Alphaproteobacteria bacterium]